MATVPQSLPTRINAATRKQHTALNRLIVARLPQALPPYVQSPALLGRGLAVFARIFVAFETVWSEMEQGCDDDKRGRRTHTEDVLASLAYLRPLGLARSERLRYDLEHIKTASGMDPGSTADGRLTADLRALVEQKPHILVAYAWVMYMAVFAGGRWIRQQLSSAGQDFWLVGPNEHVRQEKSDTATSSSLPGFTFLSFEGDHDGEDIKTTFKTRLAEVESLLTAQEKGEIVDAAQQLFELCIASVHELDRMVMWANLRRKLPAISLVVLALMALTWLYWSDNYGILRR